MTDGVGWDEAGPALLCDAIYAELGELEKLRGIAERIERQGEVTDEDLRELRLLLSGLRFVVEEYTAPLVGEEPRVLESTGDGSHIGLEKPPGAS